VVNGSGSVGVSSNDASEFYPHNHPASLNRYIYTPNKIIMPPDTPQQIALSIPQDLVTPTQLPPTADANGYNSFVLNTDGKWSFMASNNSKSNASPFEKNMEACASPNYYFKVDNASTLTSSQSVDAIAQNFRNIFDLTEQRLVLSR
jgi:hypothetical protein